MKERHSNDQLIKTAMLIPLMMKNHGAGNVLNCKGVLLAWYLHEEIYQYLQPDDILKMSITCTDFNLDQYDRAYAYIIMNQYRCDYSLDVSLPVFVKFGSGIVDSIAAQYHRSSTVSSVSTEVESCIAKDTLRSFKRIQSDLARPPKMTVTRQENYANSLFDSILHVQSKLFALTDLLNKIEHVHNSGEIKASDFINMLTLEHLPMDSFPFSPVLKSILSLLPWVSLSLLNSKDESDQKNEMIAFSRLSKTLRRKNHYAYQLFKALVTQESGRLLLQYVQPYHSYMSDTHKGSKLGVDAILRDQPLWQSFFLDRDDQSSEEYTGKIKRMFDDIKASDSRLFAEGDKYDDYRENELKFEQLFTLLRHYLMQDNIGYVRESFDGATPLSVEMKVVDSSRFCGGGGESKASSSGGNSSFNAPRVKSVGKVKADVLLTGFNILSQKTVNRVSQLFTENQWTEIKRALIALSSGYDFSFYQNMKALKSKTISNRALFNCILFKDYRYAFEHVLRHKYKEEQQHFFNMLTYTGHDRDEKVSAEILVASSAITGECEDYCEDEFDVFYQKLLFYKMYLDQSRRAEPKIKQAISFFLQLNKDHFYSHPSTDQLTLSSYKWAFAEHWSKEPPRMK